MDSSDDNEVREMIGGDTSLTGEEGSTETGGRVIPSSEFRKEFEILDQERQEIIREYRRGSVDREAVEHLEELIGSVRDTEGKLGEALEEKTNELEREIDNLKKEVSRVEDEAEGVRELEEIWEEFERIVNAMLGGARLDNPGLLSNIQSDLVDGNEDAFGYSKEKGEDPEEKDSDVLKELVSRIESEYLNPFRNTEENVSSDEQGYFELLISTARTSVSLHQDATKVKHILLRAKRDTTLQRKLIRNDSTYTEEINEKVKKAGKEEQRLERLAKSIANNENELIKGLEEAASIVKQIHGIDKDILNRMNEGLSDQSGMINSLDISNNKNLINKIDKIAQKTGDEGFEELANHLRQEFKPKLERTVNSLEQRTQAEKELANEIESYIEEHEEESEKESEAEKDIPEIPVPSEDIEDDASAPPPGTQKFIDTLKDLREKKLEGILRDVETAKKEYERVYSVNESEVEDVKNFEQRMTQFEQNLRDLKEEIEGEYEDIKKAYAQSEASRREINKIFTGEIGAKGLSELQDEISEIKNQLFRVYEDEEESKSDFREAHSSIKNVKEELEEIKTDIDSLKRIIGKLKKNTKSDDRIRTYHQAILSASKSIYPSMNKKEAQKELIGFLDSLNDWSEKVGNKLSQIEEIEVEVLDEEKIEEKKLKSSLQDAKTALKNLNKELGGRHGFVDSVDADAIPEDLAKALDQIEKELDSIQEKIKQEGKLVDQERKGVESDEELTENIEEKLRQAAEEAQALTLETGYDPKGEGLDPRIQAIMQGADIDDFNW